MEPLTDRQKRVLHSVINAHIESAQPVGSRLVADHYVRGFSPATVRHEMGKLEEMGYLMHPHTSAGRVPTDGGYRYYVNHCLEQEGAPAVLLETPVDPRGEESQELESFAEGISSLLASLCREAGLVTVSDAPVKALKVAERRKLFIRGSSYILEKPEFQNLQKIRELFRIFEEETRLVKSLSLDAPPGGVCVSIGHENQQEALWDCSVVSTSYFWRGRRIGSLGVFGPKRMHYSRIIPLVREMAGKISEKLSRWKLRKRSS